jgi:hypothetical protein
MRLSDCSLLVLTSYLVSTTTILGAVYNLLWILPTQCHIVSGEDRLIVLYVLVKFQFEEARLDTD